MTVEATIHITLGIAGPFLCSGTAPTSWGLDKTFDRDYQGRPYIDRSHIKGKLREAMEELGSMQDDANIAENNIIKWFGKETPMENGSLFFTDFRLADFEKAEELKGKPSEKKLTRIEKDDKMGVVKPNALMVMENAFPGGRDTEKGEKIYIWKGDISYTAASKEEAGAIAQEIRLGLKWIAACGSEKSIGFGRLKTVEAALAKPVPIVMMHKPVNHPSTQLNLTIKAEEPLMLGDVRIKANYQESLDYIMGSVIKGALAQAINRACGVTKPALVRIDDKNSMVKDHFPKLFQHFSAIRFTHAFPSASDKRPVVIPYSIVVAGGKHYDVAIRKDSFLPGGKLPAFQTDWKDDDWPDGFGWATPLRVAKTRTAIDNHSRRADDGSMFTYQYVCPCGEDKKDIQWVGGVYLDSNIPDDDIPALKGELECAFDLLKYLGKRASRVTAVLSPGAPVPYKTIQPIPDKCLAVIALQSDALMVKAGDLLDKKQTQENLTDLYKEYWAEITKDEESGKSCCELSHFFAMQKLRGGFLKRIKNESKPYYPYYLTEAGSVFVLNIKDQHGALKVFDLWKKAGLTLPKWAIDAYGKDIWRQCPYVPQNGFGEVVINLDLQMEKLPEEGGTKA